MGELKLNQPVELFDHATIAKVEIQKKQHTDTDTQPVENRVHEDLKQLAGQLVESHDHVPAQQPALKQDLNFKQFFEDQFEPQTDKPTQK